MIMIKKMTITPSKYVQVIMVRGIIGNWKQPIFFDYGRKITKNLLFKIITKLENIGYPVYALNCDLGGSNRGLRNSFEPLNHVMETMDTAAVGTSSKRSDVGNTNKERPPPPVIIHGFVENFNDLEQMLRRNIGKKYSIKFTRKNTTIYTQNKVDWNKVKNVLSQTETSYHSFTHKDEKTHAFVLQGLGQNPSV
jgi:hypothetical protein